MIVVAIIGVLSAIAIPKFADLIRKTKEGTTKGNLGAIRSSLSIYYGDMEGHYPSDPTSLTINSKYIKTIPEASPDPFHAPQAWFGITTVKTGDGTDGWGYNGTTSDANFGTVWVMCTHTDSKGAVWTTY